MFTYQHRTKQSWDHISVCFSLSRDHNKLCIGQCSRLSEFGVVKVRPRARLLSTQDRSGPLNSPSTPGCDTAPAACTQWPSRDSTFCWCLSHSRDNRQTLLSRNTDKTLPNQNSFWVLAQRTGQTGKNLSDVLIQTPFYHFVRPLSLLGWQMQDGEKNY